MLLPRRGATKPQQRSVSAESAGAANIVVAEILRALEQQQIVPGQRLIETELAVRYGVGRNAVREGIQQLAARGIVDLVRNRSPSIRVLDQAEAIEVLEVAEVMMGLLARSAAQNFRRPEHGKIIVGVAEELASCSLGGGTENFNRARRHFYRVLLDIAGNRELRRLFLTIHMEIIHAQYRSAKLQDIRMADYRLICAAVAAGNAKAAEGAARRHVRRVREIVEKSRASDVDAVRPR